MRKPPFPLPVFAFVGIAARTLIALGAALSLPRCTSLKAQRCNPIAATAAGYHDASAGLAPRLQLGEVCEGEYPPAHFQKDYRTGYEKRRHEVCVPAYAASLGAEEGKQLWPNRGVSLFIGCPAAVQKELSRTYASSYQDGLKEGCSVTHLYIKGIHDAETEEELEANVALLDLCPSASRASAVISYTNGYHHAREEMEKKRLQKMDSQRQRDEGQKIRDLEEKQRSQENQLRLLQKQKS